MKSPNHKSEIAELKAENKKLKALLKNAVRLLHQSKEIIQHAGNPPAIKARKKTAKKQNFRRAK